MTIHRKTPRLRPEEYIGQKTCFVTICCDRREHYLGDSQIAAPVLQALLECAVRESFRLHAYCLMPDHLHFLAQGTDTHSNLLEFIRLFKQRTAFWFRKSAGKQLWEMGFYDYILRAADSIEGVAAYIWWNPMRKGLCAEPAEFPFSGSQTIHWIKNTDPQTPWSPPWASAQTKSKARV